MRQRQKNTVGVSALLTGKFLLETTKLPLKSGKFLDSVKVFGTVWKIFQTVWKVSEQSEQFSDSLESFRTVWKKIWKKVGT